MDRIDIKTLVLAFEKRISELNKNPPNLVPSSTISMLLENAIQEEVENNFRQVISNEIRECMSKQFKKEKERLVKQASKNILTDSSFRESIEVKIKKILTERIKYISKFPSTIILGSEDLNERIQRNLQLDDIYYQEG